MKLLNKFSAFISCNKVNSFSELSNWLLALFGMTAFLVAGYLGLMLKDVVPNFVQITNDVGFTQQGISLGLLLGLFGINFWLFGCIAARCHSILYDRFFK